ncbi:phospholipid scramblase 2-like [Mercenaria mercenaria]|uniref:phospholipid scramblase 2-like n=1 Tax=Mercenaria mercenaria TaxID=6596 RepID=UPI00234F2FF5|nr:phospholipid scramblase 2-like [Mercenaria mercenaria]XP_053378763.1 phospholipid scramblase 2-like [Mercenaria mercenaria]
MTSTNQVSPVVITQPGAQGQGQAVPAQAAVYGMPGQTPGVMPGQMAQMGQMGMVPGGQEPPVVWMPKPVSGPPGGCPPGLEYLTQVDQILIKQQIDITELFTTWEKENKYNILNTMGQQVYAAKEESDTCHRQCCRANRGFVMHVGDNLGNEVIRLEREFRCCNVSWCACFGCCGHRVSVEAPPGTVVGYIKQKPTLCDPKYAILDADEKEVLHISGPCCVIQGCPCDIDFMVHSATDGQTEVGKIQKQAAKDLNEMIMKADSFGVTFPMDLDVKMKAVMIGATFLLDFLFFEKPRGRRGGRRRGRR